MMTPEDLILAAGGAVVLAVLIGLVLRGRLSLRQFGVIVASAVAGALVSHAWGGGHG